MGFFVRTEGAHPRGVDVNFHNASVSNRRRLRIIGRGRTVGRDRPLCVSVRCPQIFPTNGGIADNNRRRWLTATLVRAPRVPYLPQVLSRIFFAGWITDNQLVPRRYINGSSRLPAALIWRTLGPDDRRCGKPDSSSTICFNALRNSVRCGKYFRHGAISNTQQADVTTNSCIEIQVCDCELLVVSRHQDFSFYFYIFFNDLYIYFF